MVLLIVNISIPNGTCFVGYSLAMITNKNIIEYSVICDGLNIALALRNVCKCSRMIRIFIFRKFKKVRKLPTFKTASNLKKWFGVNFGIFSFGMFKKSHVRGSKLF